MSHSAEFIQEMKNILEEEQKLLQQNINNAEVTEYERDDDTNAIEVADQVTNTAVADIDEDRLIQVQRALQKIEEGTYGVTNDGTIIPEERLRANPAATDIVR